MSAPILANAKEFELLARLERLADPANGGTPGECAAAAGKLSRLKARVDFSQGAPQVDLFAGKFAAASFAVHIATISELDIAAPVKWAIEGATKIGCVLRGEQLCAHATNATANRLAEIACHIAESFRAVLPRFSAVSGVTPGDRQAFLAGLYDGMMGETRQAGARLPPRLCAKAKAKRAGKRAVAHAPGLGVHPYTLGVGLGKQIRFSATLDEIKAEIERAIAGQLGETTERKEDG